MELFSLQKHILHKMYVKPDHRLTREQLDVVLDSLEVDRNVHLDVLVAIDYVFHGTEDNFDGGLGFLDRLYHKLAMYFDIAWDLDGIKSIIRESTKPQEEYYDILSQMLTPDMIACYGV